MVSAFNDDVCEAQDAKKYGFPQSGFKMMMKPFEASLSRSVPSKANKSASKDARPDINSKIPFSILVRAWQHMRKKEGSVK